MALKALMLRKRLSDANKALEAFRAKDAEFETREADLAKSIEEVQSEEERTAVDEAITEFEAEKQAHEDAKGELERQIEQLEGDLAEEEAQQDTDPVDDPVPAEEKRGVKHTMSVRNKIFATMDAQTRRDMFERDDVKEWIGSIRTCIKEKRAVTNVGLTIPQVFLGVLRQNVENYSKLYKHVTVKPVSGTGRELIMGGIPEAIWTECCANLNEHWST